MSTTFEQRRPWYSVSLNIPGCPSPCVQLNSCYNSMSRYTDCALSQVRGPKSARIYSELQKQLHPESQQEVLVLRGGFTEFAQQYKVRRIGCSQDISQGMELMGMPHSVCRMIPLWWRSITGKTASRTLSSRKAKAEYRSIVLVDSMYHE